MTIELEIREGHGGFTQAIESNAIGNVVFAEIDQLLSEPSDSEVTQDVPIRLHIQIGGLLDPRLRMNGSLTLQIERDGDFYVAGCDELNEYGYGRDPISAVQDARHTIAELYWQLKAEQERLGPDLVDTWQALSALVYEA